MVEELCVRDPQLLDRLSRLDGVYTESRFWQTLRNATKAMGSAALRPALELYFVMAAPETPLAAKATAVAALAYLICPLDVIPDMLPGIGWTDDIAVMLGALRTLRAHNTPAIQEKARDAAERFMTAMLPGRQPLA
jgi:uncharacterized membrane protein YkvA (DUF1232 family)